MNIKAIPPAYLVAAGVAALAIYWFSKGGPEDAGKKIAGGAVDMATGILSGTVDAGAKAAAPFLDPITKPIAEWWVNIKTGGIVGETTPEEREKANAGAKPGEVAGVLIGGMGAPLDLNGFSDPREWN